MKNSKYKVLNIVIILALLIALMALASSNFLGANCEVNTANAESTNQFISIEMLNNVDDSFAFQVLSDIQLTDNNIKNYVSVLDINEQPESIKVQKVDTYYEIIPEKKYKEGGIYKVILNDGVKFRNPTYRNGLMFSVKKAKDLQALYKSNVIHIDKADVVSVDIEDKALLIDEPDFIVGDVLIIPTLIPNSNNYIDVAYKVENIHGNYVEFSTPELDEVYSKFSICDEFKASSAIAYDQDVIIDGLLNDPEIDSISKALNDLKNGGQEKKGISLTPKKIDINFILM